jgi:hypothetical protein
MSKVVDAMNPDELRATLHRIADVFGIGSGARTPCTLLGNIENANRRCDCLGEIEHFHVETVPDEEEGGDMELSLLNWGENPDTYIETYKGVMAGMISAERERCIKRLLELVPMTDPDLTTDYLREELAK